MIYRVAYCWIHKRKRIEQVFYGTLEQWEKHKRRLGVVLVRGLRPAMEAEYARNS